MSALALVTGASRGIGRAIAERLASEGWTVVGTATSESGAASINDWLQPLGGTGRRLDVCKGAEAAALVAELERDHADAGGIDLLVNNAGITRDMVALRLKDEDWDAVVATNLAAPLRMCSLVAPAMKARRRGRIVNIGSVVGNMGNFGQSNYAAAKSGLCGMSRALADELGGFGITVNVVAPGMIETDMTRNLPDDVMKKLMERLLIQRLGKPEEIAGAVAFLASPHASYITGHTLHINGGLLMA